MSEQTISIELLFTRPEGRVTSRHLICEIGDQRTETELVRDAVSATIEAPLDAEVTCYLQDLQVENGRLVAMGKSDPFHFLATRERPIPKPVLVINGYSTKSNN